MVLKDFQNHTEIISFIWLFDSGLDPRKCNHESLTVFVFVLIKMTKTETNCQTNTAYFAYLLKLLHRHDQKWYNKENRTKQRDVVCCFRKYLLN